MKIKVIASSSAGNCYLVSDGKTPILLDCGMLLEATKRLWYDV